MLAPLYYPSDSQTPSNRTLSTSIAFSDASKNVAENVPRLILFAMLASVSFKTVLFEPFG